ncbi:MAG: hypothetical protein V4598_09540 [Bdellovibrionota bacterium]
MKSLFLAALFSFSAFATEGDLTIPNQKWKSTFKNYNCAAFGPAIEVPASHRGLDVKFETITTDSTLDNGLLKASFTEGGKACRYSAILLADNAAATIRIVESKAFAPVDDSTCAAGKAILDRNLEANNYLYWGHPHNLTILAPSEDAQALCGSDYVGINFVVTGRIE